MKCLVFFVACTCTPHNPAIDDRECVDTGVSLSSYQTCPMALTSEPPKPVDPVEHAIREAERLNKELGSP